MKKGTDIKQKIEDLLGTAREGTSQDFEKLVTDIDDDDIFRQAASIVIPPDNQTLLMLAVSSGNVKTLESVLEMYKLTKKLPEHLQLTLTKSGLNILQCAMLSKNPRQMVKMVTDLVMQMDPTGSELFKMMTQNTKEKFNALYLHVEDPERGLLYAIYKARAKITTPGDVAAIINQIIEKIYSNVVPEDIMKVVGDLLGDKDWFAHAFGKDKLSEIASGDVKDQRLVREIIFFGIRAGLPTLHEVKTLNRLLDEELKKYTQKAKKPGAALNLTLSSSSQRQSLARSTRSLADSTRFSGAFQSAASTSSSASQTSASPQTSRSRATSASSKKSFSDSGSATSSSGRSRSTSAPAQPFSSTAPSIARPKTPPPAQPPRASQGGGPRTRAVSTSSESSSTSASPPPRRKTPPAQPPQPSQGGGRARAVSTSSSSSDSSSSSASDQVFNLTLSSANLQRAQQAAGQAAKPGGAAPATPAAGGAPPRVQPAARAPARPQGAAPAVQPAIPPAGRAAPGRAAAPAVQPAGRAAAPVVPPVRPQAPPPPDPTQTMTTTMAQTHNPSQAVSAAVTTYMKTHQNKAPNQGELNTMARQATRDPQERDKLLLAIRSRFKK
ncbi:MAG: hypothetical protein ACHQJ6_02835 [Candidatus Berkiellales bacterium]